MRRVLLACLSALPLLAAAQAPTQAPTQAPADSLRHFAIEFRSGPAWVADKPPPEQAGFREHSANLRRLRDAGRLLIGARIAERGFLVLSADSEAAARAEFDADPTLASGVFVVSIQPMQVFWGGSLQPARR